MHRAQAQPSRAPALHYIDRSSPGIRRIRRGRGLSYTNHNRRPVTDSITLSRIHALVLPPAWKNVWISPDPRGHIQATGIDARGRTQYRYHADWTAHRNLSKFAGLSDFAKLLPRIRRRIKRDLALPNLPKDKVLAAIVHIMDTAHLRIGNAEYARDNHSYGLTTIHNHHAVVRGDDIRFRFRAKSGKDCDVSLHHPTIARIVRRCQDLPGQELFAYLDERARTHDVTSADVNDYLQRITGANITAKDFRTWHGTVIAAEIFLAVVIDSNQSQPLSPAAQKKLEVAAIRAAATALNNTLATCRKFYVHPSLAPAHADGTLHRLAAALNNTHTPRGLRAIERIVASLLADAAPKIDPVAVLKPLREAA